jgi:hypothetical protein
MLQLPMSENHEQRYVIVGPDTYVGEGNDGGVATSTMSVLPTDGQLHAYSPAAGMLTVVSNQLIKSVVVYDMLGRVLLEHDMNLWNNEVTLPVPSGMCVVEAHLSNQTTLHQQAMVK